MRRKIKYSLLQLREISPHKEKNQPVAVTVTYADGTTDTVTVTVTYGDASDVYNPIGQEIPVNKGSQPNAEDGIQNKNDLPQGTTYDWKTPVDTSTPGETTGTVIVTYPDGSKDEVEVKVNVIDPRTDAEKYQPETIPEIIKPGEKPDLSDNVTNPAELPNGTIIKDITPDGTVDTDTLVSIQVLWRLHILMEAKKFLKFKSS